MCSLDSFYTNLYLSSDIHIIVVNIKLDWKKFSFACIHFILFCCLVCNIFEMNNVQFDVSMWYCDNHTKGFITKMVMYIANVPLGSVKRWHHTCWTHFAPYSEKFWEDPYQISIIKQNSLSDSYLSNDLIRWQLAQLPSDLSLANLLVLF